MPYSDWSQTMLDWYWAGMALFLPSSRQLSDIWGGGGRGAPGGAPRCTAAPPGASACREPPGHDDWELPEDLLHAVLRRTNKVPCYAGLSPNAGRKPELDADFASTESFVAGCERILAASGDAPVSCFWANEEVRRAWLKHLWFYRVPFVYHWDNPEDLARKLVRWTWLEAREHRERLSGHLNESLASVQSELVSRLEKVRSDLQAAECPVVEAATPVRPKALAGVAATVGSWEADMVGERPGSGLRHGLPPAGRPHGGRPRQFEVILERSSGEDLGLLVDASDRKALVVLEVQAGPVRGWNIAHPGRRVEPRDRIVAANGARGSALDLFRALRGRRRAELLVEAA